jgi:predicted Zn-dependent protease
MVSHRLCTFLLVLLPAACVSLDALSDGELNSVGLQVYEEVVANNQVISSGPDYEMAQRVGHRIVWATGEDLPWQVKLLKADEIANAVSLPGGRIAIYSGILKITENESGLAVVIGHEIAHAVLRHGRKRLAECRLLSHGFVACQQGPGTKQMRPEVEQGIMSAFGIGAPGCVFLPFSSNHEAEADELGLRFAIRAGYDPWEAPKLWLRMAKFDKSNAPDWIRPHPASETRAATLQALIPRLIAEEAAWQPKPPLSSAAALQKPHGA